ncbi:MAG: ABC transporter permease [Nanoarchaeota archaeon]|nr:ABC transporter permease [Nanoarchaeota archaeon]
MIKEFATIAWQSLTRRRLRSWLTMIGIFIGIAAVVSLISLSLGMKAAIVQTFEDLGSDKIFIQPKTSFGVIGDNTGSNPLTEKDLNFLEGESGVNRVSGYTLASAKIEFQGETRYFSIIGVPQEPDRMSLITELYSPDAPLAGRNLLPSDNKVVNMGFYHYTKGLYNGKNVQINDRVLVNGEKFTVIGIFAPLGSSSDDQMIYMPMRAFREVTGIEDRIDQIIVEVDPTKDPLIVANELKRSLARYRGVKDGQEDFTVQTPDDILATFNTILNIVQAVLIGISLISLFVGSIGIMNTMYTSVLERKKEIGIMKAIGATNKHIFTLFFVESGFLGLVGGILGIILGTIFATLVEVISKQALGKTFLQASYSWELFASALLFSFLIGALSGTLPARQASKLQPVETLQDE